MNLLLQWMSERTSALAEARTLVDGALAADRDMNGDEQTRYDGLVAKVDGLKVKIDREQALQEREAQTAGTQRAAQKPSGAPPVLKYGRGDSEEKAFRTWVTTGDRSGLAHLMRTDAESGNKPQIVLSVPTQRETRAVVDSTMNITTAADGANLVPTTLVAKVATRKNELMLAEVLGCRRVPGSGTTVNYPYEGADPEAFAATSEQSDAHGNNYERDAGNTLLKAFTLAKFTRKIELTEEIVEDEGAGMMDYIADRIGRQIAKTHNALLFAQAATGTSLKSFNSNAAIAAGEPEAVVGNDALGFYLDEARSVNWAMRSSTHWSIKAITGNSRLYGENSDGLLGYPVRYSNQVAAIGAAAKSVFFGNWDYMGYRESPELRFISDPYSVDGMVVLKYSFRAVYGILQAAAIGYGVHP